MRIVPDVKAGTVQQVITQMLGPEASLSTDGHRSHPVVARNLDPIKEASHLKWLHPFGSNAKAFIAGTYHGMDRKHLQAYLDEF